MSLLKLWLAILPRAKVKDLTMAYKILHDLPSLFPSFSDVILLFSPLFNPPHQLQWLPYHCSNILSYGLCTGCSSACHFLSLNICMANPLNYFNSFLQCHLLVSPLPVIVPKTAKFSELPILLTVFHFFP